MTSSLSKAPRIGALPPPPVNVLNEALGTEALSIDWLAGDGSDRCYYRLRDKNKADTFVLMQLSGNDAKALQENGYDWIRLAELLEKHNVFVPRVIAKLPEYAALIIEDYGDTMLETEVLRLVSHGDLTTTRKIYQDAIEIIGNFLLLEPSDDAVWCQRRFDAERYEWELDFFLKNYAGPVAGIEFSSGDFQRLQGEIKSFSQFLGEYSKYFVHRDYHSRNLMYRDGKLAVIDFQDGRLGSNAYDLVSLCFDSYIPFETTFRNAMLQFGRSHIGAVLGSAAQQAFDAHWRPMLLQRQLKAIGSFGFLTRVKNRGNYLQYVAPALNCLEEKTIFDKRWPILSGVLIEKLKAYVGPG